MKQLKNWHSALKVDHCLQAYWHVFSILSLVSNLIQTVQQVFLSRLFSFNTNIFCKPAKSPHLKYFEAQFTFDTFRYLKSFSDFLRFSAIFDDERIGTYCLSIVTL